MVEGVFVVVRRDDETAYRTGVIGVGKVPRVVRLLLRSGIEKAPLGFRVAGAEEISRQTEPRKRRPLETYLGVSKLGLAR